MKQQTYANHVRWYPLVHFVIMPLLVINFVYQAVRLFQEPSWDRGMWVLLCLVFILIVFASRLQALKAQDRVIRLEELLRYRQVLPAELEQRARDLPAARLIAMRFASDDELPHLVTEVLDGRLARSRDIKQAIKQWRGDHHRV